MQPTLSRRRARLYRRVRHRPLRSNPRLPAVSPSAPQLGRAAPNLEGKSSAACLVLSTSRGSLETVTSPGLGMLADRSPSQPGFQDRARETRLGTPWRSPKLPSSEHSRCHGERNWAWQRPLRSKRGGGMSPVVLVPNGGHAAHFLARGARGATGRGCGGGPFAGLSKRP